MHGLILRAWILRKFLQLHWSDYTQTLFLTFPFNFFPSSNKTNHKAPQHVVAPP